jgi:hypothetical protein
MFAKTYCSQCGGEFGPGESGFSHCSDHRAVVTLEVLQKCHMKESAHGHGTGMFFYIHRCVEHPRLSRRDHYAKKDRSVTSTWRVDGEDVKDLAEAVEKLNRPPSLTDEERAILATVPDEWTDWRKEDLSAMRFYTLAEKGLVEWRDGKCRRAVAA